MRGGGVKSKTVVESPFEVTKNSFNNKKMRLTGIVHVEANLLNGIGNVRSCESNVLEGTG